MGYYCTVPQCTSLAGKTKNVKFHRFPRDTTLADKWNLILKRGKPYTKYSKVCSLHFTQADYNVTTMGQWKTLSKDAVPSQNLPKLHPDGTVMVIRKSRTVKYRETIKKEDGDKTDKWLSHMSSHMPHPASTPLPPDVRMNGDGQETSSIIYTHRYPTLTALTSAVSHPPTNPHMAHALPKPKKQDAIMQTDPVVTEDDDSQPDNSYNEVSNKYPETVDQYNQSYQSQKAHDNYTDPKSHDYEKQAKDYTKQDEYLPKTNEEYNKEAEKYALERKSLNGYEKALEAYHKIPDPYSFDKSYPRSDYVGYQGYPDNAELLRNQQNNLQILQEQPHRVTENQNFFNENHIKQEVDNMSEEDKFMYERNKEQLDVDVYNNRRLIDQQRLLDQIQHQVKQEPDATSGCENVMQPQGSPYYQSNSHNNAQGYYEPLSRPGPELLIAKQNALAAHTQLWQNTMKRPFFYSESPHYNSAQLLHRCEEFPRILQ